MAMLTFRELEPGDNRSVRDMVLHILNEEYAMALTLDELPDLVDIHASYRTRGSGNFWVAAEDDRIVGCIGVWHLAGADYELRRMYVEAGQRGRGLAQQLLAVVFDWCEHRAVDCLWLETNASWVAAQHIYRKNGFLPVARDELPPAFPVVRIATGFYRRSIAHPGNH